uniref:Uncharacterized protein n=1 Tax=Rhizophora mucronata TaxID=61149 RepID=A0A2P2PHZ6_RHIMU
MGAHNFEILPKLSLVYIIYMLSKSLVTTLSWTSATGPNWSIYNIDASWMPKSYVACIS